MSSRKGTVSSSPYNSSPASLLTSPATLLTFTCASIGDQPAVGMNSAKREGSSTPATPLAATRFFLRSSINASTPRSSRSIMHKVSKHSHHDDASLDENGRPDVNTK